LDVREAPMGNTVATDFLPTSADQDDGVFVPYPGDGRWRYRWEIRCSADPK
jgi:signal recognition particle receptor subunit beta